MSTAINFGNVLEYYFEIIYENNVLFILSIFYHKSDILMMKKKAYFLSQNRYTYNEENSFQIDKYSNQKCSHNQNFFYVTEESHTKNRS